MTTTNAFQDIKPQRPWQASTKDKLISLAIFLSSVVLAYGVVLVTGLSGKLGMFTSFVFIFIVITAGRSYLQFGSALAKDSLVKILVAVGTFLTLIPIASILFEVFSKGYKGLYPGLFVRDMSLNSPNDPANVGGLGHAILGTLTLVAIALVISVPVGILTALYLTEIKGSRTSAIDGVALSQPSLALISKLLHRAEKFGVELDLPNSTVTDADSAADQIVAIAAWASANEIDLDALLRKRARALMAQIQSVEAR